MSKWKPVVCGVPQVPYWDQYCSISLLNHIDSRNECTLRKFADDTKLSGAADLLEE